MDLTKEQYQKYVYSLNHPNMEDVHKRMSESISESDIYRYFGNTFNIKEDVIVYSDLEQYDNIEQVLEADKQWKIILIEEEVNTGHWVALIRHNKQIIYFNSYGAKPSYELDLIDEKQNEKLGQDEKYLNKLLLLAKGKYRVLYNKKRFQKLDNQITTCGRHVIMYIIMVQKFNYSLEQYIRFMERLKKHYNMTFDEIVSLIII